MFCTVLHIDIDISISMSKHCEDPFNVNEKNIPKLMVCNGGHYLLVHSSVAQRKGDVQTNDLDGCFKPSEEMT